MSVALELHLAEVSLQVIEDAMTHASSARSWFAINRVAGDLIMLMRRVENNEDLRPGLRESARRLALVLAQDHHTSHAEYELLDPDHRLVAAFAPSTFNSPVINQP